MAVSTEFPETSAVKSILIHEDIKRIPVEFHIVVVKGGVTAMTVPLCCS